MDSKGQIKSGRRKMIRAMGWLILIPLVGVWDMMIRRDQANFKRNEIKILLSEIPDGVTFYNDFILKKDASGIIAFSTRCTHLGCRLRPSGDGRMICPCHGSSFDMANGAVLNGPALKPLKVLDYYIKDDYLIISVA